MRVRSVGVLVAAVFVLGAAVPAFSHHAFGVEYDNTKCMDLKGTLTAVQWQNPHAYIDMEVKDAEGKMVKWHLEMVTPNALKRTGTARQDFEANFGKIINVRMCQSRVGVGKGAASYLALSDGAIRLVGQGVERRSDEQKRFNP